MRPDLLERRSVSPVRTRLVIALCCAMLPLAVLRAANSSVRGTVSERERESARPAAGAFVSILSSAGRLLATTRADRQGRYRFSQIAAGRYFVTASRPGYFVNRAGGRTPVRRPCARTAVIRPRWISSCYEALSSVASS